MSGGTLGGGGVELPVSVVQVTPQSFVIGGSGDGSGMSSNPAKPFIEAGAGPPLMRLIFAHWLLHQVRELPIMGGAMASRSPTTNVPPEVVGKATTSTLQVATVLLPPSSTMVVVTVSEPVTENVTLPVPKQCKG